MNLLLRVRAAWAQMRFTVGYLLFAATVWYALDRTPPELWTIDARWLLGAVGNAVLLFLLQHAQVVLFLRRHRHPAGGLYPLLFTARRSVLNSLLPARLGTVVVLPMLSDRYALRWHDFLVYMLVASLASALISAVGAAWLLCGSGGALVATIAVLLACGWLVRSTRLPYAGDLPALLALAVGIFVFIALGFYCVLRGLGHALTLREVTTVAVLLNVLALVSITPGNVGVREMVLGAAAPLLALPLPVAILASAAFHIVRVLAYGLILVCTEWLARRTPP